MHVKSLKHLAREIQKIKGFEKPKIKLEQYITEADIAAEVLWNAYMIGDVEGKIIADLGCGTGKLGIGALWLGAGHVFFTDIDATALGTLRQNLEDWEEDTYTIIQGDINGADIKADTVVMNPPFGTKTEHADRKFLEKAFKVAETIYSFHKTSTKGFVTAITKDNDFQITQEWNFSYPLKNTSKYHSKDIQRIEVTCFRLKRKE